MPKYRRIDIALHSQFDIETIPEYYPEPKEAYVARGIEGFVPELVHDKTSTCSVYVPVLPGSTFWISYSVSPPVPDGHYFLFKLYINGTHIVSWSTGKDEQWRGKTMFGLYEGHETTTSKRAVEKRILRFAPPNQKVDKHKETVGIFDEAACIEVRVHRADGRKRVERELQRYHKTQYAKTGKVIDLVYAGRASSDQPKRFYHFALIDPIDQPFATFRYYYRTWDQLQVLGFLSSETNTVGEDCDLSVIEPSVVEPGHNVIDCSADDVSVNCHDGPASDLRATTAEHAGSKAEDNHNVQTSSKFVKGTTVATSRPSTPSSCIRQGSNSFEKPHSYIPQSAPRSTTPVGSDRGIEGESDQRDSCVRTPPQFYRLSVPPAVSLLPPDQGSQTHATMSPKNMSSSSTSRELKGAYPLGDWAMKTPSPVKSIRENIRTPSPGTSRQSRAASALMSMITSTWKRRGTEPAAGAARSEESRSVSR
ncbi:hypothetical protein ACN47E_001757 [Coniothyrium glycines]